MTDQLKEEVLSAPEVIAITDRLNTLGAPVALLKYQAIQLASESNAGYRVAVEIVCGFLMPKLNKLEAECEPKSTWGKIIKALAVLFRK